MKISENYSLKPYNTFNIDVCCKYFVEADDEKELLDFVAAYEWNPFEILILGGGSDFLFTEVRELYGMILLPGLSDRDMEAWRIFR